MIHHQGVQSCAWLKLLVVVHIDFDVCLVGVWERNFEPVVCVYGTAGQGCVFAFKVDFFITVEGTYKFAGRK